MLEKSGKSGKLISMMLYADWCEHCQKMKAEVLKDPAVISFFNSNFINYMVNAETFEGVGFLRKFDVKNYPAFLFFDQSEVLRYKLTGELKTEDFISEAGKALDPKQQLPTLEKRFFADTKNSDNCLAYINLLKKGNDRIKMTSVAQAYLANIPDSALATDNNWKIIVLGINDLNSRELKYVLKHQKEFAVFSSEKKVTGKFLNAAGMLLRPEVENRDLASYDKDRVLAKSLGLMKVDSLVFRLDLEVYENINWPKYFASCREGVNKFAWNDYSLLNEICKNFIDNSSDPDDLKKAIEWTRRSIELNETHINDFNLARLYYKTGDKKSAKKYALKTKDFLETAGWDKTKVEKFLVEIEKK